MPDFNIDLVSSDEGPRLLRDFGGLDHETIEAFQLTVEDANGAAA